MRKEIKKAKRIIAILDYICIIMGATIPIVMVVDWVVGGYENHWVLSIYLVITVLIIAISQYLGSLFRIMIKDIRHLYKY